MSIFKIKNLLLLILLVISGCTRLPVNNQSSPTYVITNTESTVLGQLARKDLGENTQESKVYLLNNGVDAFVSRAALIERAEKSIDVQYYIWHSDLLGKILFHSLFNAAERGVRVRMLLDDMPLEKDTEAILYALDQHPNIEVRLYNPFASRQFRIVDFILNPVRINRRMHNKSFTADSQYTIVGGRNIGNEYFYADEWSNFSDIDVFAVGPVVQEVGKQFDLYWNSPVVFPVKAFSHNSADSQNLDLLSVQLKDFEASKDQSRYHLDIKDSMMYQSIINGNMPQSEVDLIFQCPVHVIYDDPQKGLGKSEHEVTYLKSLLEPYVSAIEHSLEIISPYFVPGSEGVAFLSMLVKKGIKVRVITNSLASTDGLLAQSGYARRRRALLAAGVQLYEFKADYKTHISKSLRRGEKAKSALHAKTYIFDRQQVFIGSFNFDPRSLHINAEIGVVIESAEMARFFSSRLFDERIKELSYEVKLAQQSMQINGVNITKGEIYWVETLNKKQVYYTTEPSVSVWRRMGQFFFSLIPIESQL